MSQHEMREADLRFYGGEELAWRWEWAKGMEQSHGRPALIYFANPEIASQPSGVKGVSKDWAGTPTAFDA